MAEFRCVGLFFLVDFFFGLLLFLGSAVLIPCGCLSHPLWVSSFFLNYLMN